MEDLNQRLLRLQGQTVRLERTEAVLEEHLAERRELEAHVHVLRQQSEAEQSQVEALERKGLKAFFYQFLGTIEEKLDKERREAREANRKFQEALGELDALNFRISTLEEERKTLLGCRRQLDEALEEKKKALRGENGEGAKTLLKKEQELEELRSRQVQIREALAAGREAGRMTDSILSKLDEAEDWGVMDMAGGGLMTDLVKHDALDTAQQGLDELQHALERFKKELADVDALRDLRIQIDGFLRFADYVFDGLFVDWTVLDQISQSKNQVETVRNQIIRVLDHLESSLEQAQEEEESLSQELGDWLVGG